MRSGFLRLILSVTCLTTLTIIRAGSEELAPISLPSPQLDGGRPLMDALRRRHTTREFKPDKLPPQVMANLLWAAFGINRPDTGQRTAPSAVNSQEVEL